MDHITNVSEPVAGLDDINEFVAGRPYFVLVFDKTDEDGGRDMVLQVGNAMQSEENLALLPRALFTLAQEL